MIPDLVPLRPRNLLDQAFNAENHGHVTRFLEDLSAHPPHDFRSAHRWYTLFHEGSSAISEAHVRLEVATSLDTESKEAESRLRHFDERVLSQLLNRRMDLMKIYMESPWRTAMHPDDRGRILRDFNMRLSCTGPQIAELQIEENQIVREYRRFMHLGTGKFEGRQVPISVLVGRMSENDSDTRRESFMSYWNFIRDNEESLQSLFTSLLKNRKEQAKRLALSSYLPIAFAELGRTDYGASECAALRNSVEQNVVPVLSRLEPAQRTSLNTATLRPWDAGIWPTLMPQTDPAGANLDTLIVGLEQIAGRIHPAFGRLVATLRNQSLIDIKPRRGKAPGAFCVFLHESGAPFIFGNFSGNFKDALTLLHEFGHALHGHASSFVGNILARTPGMEFCEFAATGFEVLAAPHLEAWWPSPGEANRARAFQLFGMLNFLPFMSMIDAWQHEIYESDLGMSDQHRNKVWCELSRRFRPQLDWSGCEEFEALGWFSRPHIFTSPFYYVDYGIAHVAAFELWSRMRSHPKEALQGYIAGLSLGAQRTLPELFAATGLSFQFSSGMREAAEGIAEEIARLGRSV